MMKTRMKEEDGATESRSVAVYGVDQVSFNHAKPRNYMKENLRNYEYATWMQYLIPSYGRNRVETVLYKFHDNRLSVWFGWPSRVAAGGEFRITEILPTSEPAHLADFMYYLLTGIHRMNDSRITFCTRWRVLSYIATSRKNDPRQECDAFDWNCNRFQFCNSTNCTYSKNCSCICIENKIVIAIAIEKNIAILIAMRKQIAIFIVIKSK